MPDATHIGIFRTLCSFRIISWPRRKRKLKEWRSKWYKRNKLASSPFRPSTKNQGKSHNPHKTITSITTEASKNCRSLLSTRDSTTFPGRRIESAKMNPHSLPKFWTNQSPWSVGIGYRTCFMRTPSGEWDTRRWWTAKYTRNNRWSLNILPVLLQWNSPNITISWYAKKSGHNFSSLYNKAKMKTVWDQSHPFWQSLLSPRFSMLN